RRRRKPFTTAWTRRIGSCRAGRSVASVWRFGARREAPQPQPCERHDRGSLMLPRFAMMLIAAGALLGSFQSAHSQNTYEDRLEMLRGGAPIGRSNFNLFGLGGTGSVTRTRVHYSTAQPPGTIVVNTAER